jgi:hypothetical protein
MRNTNAFMKTPTRCVTALAVAAILSLTLARTACAGTTAPATLQTLDDKLPSAPLAVSFDKVTDAESGPYVLKLKNTSGEAVTASAKIFPSVTIHSDTKERDLPERVVASGEVWSIPGLAATDKVTVNAKGFAPLEITVP